MRALRGRQPKYHSGHGSFSTPDGQHSLVLRHLQTFVTGRESAGFCAGCLLAGTQETCFAAIDRVDSIVCVILNIGTPWCRLAYGVFRPYLCFVFVLSPFEFLANTTDPAKNRKKKSMYVILHKRTKLFIIDQWPVIWAMSKRLYLNDSDARPSIHCWNSVSPTYAPRSHLSPPLNPFRA